MAAYYVDYENVRSSGLTGLETLTGEDTVFLLYSEKADSLHFQDVQRILATEADLHVIKADVGTPNALDFELVTLLVHNLNHRDDAQSYIISGDKGYRVAIRMAGRLGYQGIREVRTIAEGIADKVRREALESSAPETRGIPETPEAEEQHWEVLTEDFLQETSRQTQEGEPTAAEDTKSSRGQAGTQGASVSEPDSAARKQDEPAEEGNAASAEEKGQQEPSGESAVLPVKDPLTKAVEKVQGISSKHYDAICAILRESSNKAEFYHKFTKQFGQQQGLDLYRKVKSHFNEWKKL